MNLGEDFKNIFNALQILQNHLEVEVNTLNNRIGYLEEKQNKDDAFFKDLETLIKERNRQ